MGVFLKPGVGYWRQKMSRSACRVCCRYRAGVRGFPGAAEVENKLNGHAAGFTALPGLGARGAVDRHAVIVGREKYSGTRGLDIHAELAASCAAWERAGHTVARHPRRRPAAPVGDNPPGDGSEPEEQAASCLE